MYTQETIDPEERWSQEQINELEGFDVVGRITSIQDAENLTDQTSTSATDQINIESGGNMTKPIKEWILFSVRKRDTHQPYVSSSTHYPAVQSTFLLCMNRKPYLYITHHHRLNSPYQAKR